MSPFCSHCGHTNRAEVRICVACGHALGGDCGSLFPSATCFVGRQEEIAALKWQFTQATLRQGSLVLLAGEMGTGKTRLVREFAQLIPESELVALWGSCYEGDWHPSYGPWVEALRPVVASMDRKQLQRALGPDAWALLPLLPELDTSWPGLSAPAALSREQERLRLYDAITQLLLNISLAKPLLLVFDDLQWADPDSLRLLRHVGHFLRRMRAMMVGVYQNGGVVAESPSLLETITSIKHETDYREISLRGLDRDAVADYLAHVLGYNAPATLTEILHRETGGNPFYLRELVRHLLEAGEIQEIALSSPAEVELRGPSIPVGIRQILRQRVARLSETTHKVLHIAAACMRGFTLPLLQVLTDLPENTLLDCLDEGLRAGFIQSIGGTPSVYQLSHAIVRHTLYSEWNPDRRLRLHRQIAQAMERVYAGHEEEHAAELAAQYYASRELPGASKGIPFALMAAEQAGAVQGPRQEVTYLRMALELAAPSSDQATEAAWTASRAEILRHLAVAEARALLWDAVPDTVETALGTTCESGGDGPTCSSFMDTVVRALQEGGAPAQFWDPLVDRGLELAGAQRDPLWARLTLLHSCLEPLANGPVQGGRWLGYDREAVAILHATGDEDDTVRALDPLAWRTREETQEILRFAERAIRPTAILGALQVALDDLVYRHGDLQGALATSDHLLSVGQRYGSIPAQAEALAQSAGIHTLLGDLALGRDIWRRARDLIARLGPEQPLRFREIEIGSRLAYLGGGDWVALAKAAFDYATSPMAAKSPFGLLAAATAALCLGRADQIGDAQSLIEWLTPLMAVREPITHTYTLTVAMAAAAVWDLEATTHAGAYRLLALELLDAGATFTAMGPLDLVTARMAALDGDMAEADTYFARAREVAETSECPPFQALVDYDQARAHIRAGSPDAHGTLELLEAARAALRSLDMQDWVERTEKLRAQVAVGQSSASRSAGVKRASHGPSYPDGLTHREVQVLLLVADGKTNQEIADELVLSIATVQRHVANIYNKIDARNRSDATSYALRRHLVPPY